MLKSLLTNLYKYQCSKKFALILKLSNSAFQFQIDLNSFKLIKEIVFSGVSRKNAKKIGIHYRFIIQSKLYIETNMSKASPPTMHHYFLFCYWYIFRFEKSTIQAISLLIFSYVCKCVSWKLLDIILKPAQTLIFPTTLKHKRTGIR